MLTALRADKFRKKKATSGLYLLLPCWVIAWFVSDVINFRLEHVIITSFPFLADWFPGAFFLRSSSFWFAFALDDHDFVWVCEVFFELFLRFPFLSSSAEAFAFSHDFHVSRLVAFSILSSRSGFLESRVGSASTHDWVAAVFEKSLL